MFGSGLVLLGEAAKVAAVSSYRFVSVEQQPATLSVTVRGAPGETVELLFASGGDGDGDADADADGDGDGDGGPAGRPRPPRASAWHCSPVNATVGPTGTATVRFPPHSA